MIWQTPLNEWNTRGRRFPAFRLRFDEGAFVVAANEQFWYYLTNLFGSGTVYTLQLRDSDGRIREAPLETLPFADYRAFLDHGGTAQFRPNREGTEVEFFDSGATAYFLYSSFHLSADEKKKVDGVFQQIQARGSRNLILDLRGNGGGASTMGEYLFRNLYGGRFCAVSKVRAKASWDVLGEVPWWARPLVFFLRGRTITHPIGERPGAKSGVFFSGRLYLLTDYASFSMATSFAAMVRDYKVGTIVG